MRYQSGMQRRYGAGTTPETSDAEFAARVESVGPEPGFVSGRAPAFQRLDVTVTDVRRGSDVSVGDYLPVDVLIRPAIHTSAWVSSICRPWTGRWCSLAS